MTRFKISLLATALVAAFALAGCNKGPDATEVPSAEANAQRSMPPVNPGGGAPGGAPGGMAPGGGGAVNDPRMGAGMSNPNVPPGYKKEMQRMQGGGGGR